jgi:hypothetical protein
MERLFERFDAMLRQAGYLGMGGQIVDATRGAGAPAQADQAPRGDGQRRRRARTIEFPALGSRYTKPRLAARAGAETPLAPFTKVAIAMR